MLGDGPGGKVTFRWWRGCADLAKTEGLKLADITDKQYGLPYLEILIDWLENDFQACSL